MDHILQNFENEEDYEEINPLEIKQHDWKEVVAGAKNLHEEAERSFYFK